MTASDDPVPDGERPEALPRSKGPKRRRGRSAGDTLGGIIVGFDQQIMRTLPPPHELVLKGAPVRGLTAADGGDLEILFPDPPEDDATTEG